MTLTPQINQHQWVQLPAEIRIRLAEIFKIPRSEASAIMGNTLISDGHSNNDLATLTKEKLESYLALVPGSNIDFYQLFDMVVKLVDKNKVFDENAKIEQIETENIGKWLIILNDIKQKAQELGLEEKFIQLVNTIYAQPVQKQNKQGGEKGIPKKMGNR